MLLAVLAVGSLACGLRARAEEAGNPTGTSGDSNGEVTTAGGYDPFTGNAKRAVTDLAVQGANGAYPLALTRVYNSRPVAVGGNREIGVRLKWH